VAVDAPRQHDQTTGIALDRFPSDGKRLANGDDAPVVEQKVGDVVVDRGYDASVADDGGGHGRSPGSATAMCQGAPPRTTARRAQLP
jgi:hypothetical protein